MTVADQLRSIAAAVGTDGTQEQESQIDHAISQIIKLYNEAVDLDRIDATLALELLELQGGLLMYRSNPPSKTDLDQNINDLMIVADQCEKGGIINDDLAFLCTVAADYIGSLLERIEVLTELNSKLRDRLQ
jgi:hypothetical protein